MTLQQNGTSEKKVFLNHFGFKKKFELKQKKKEFEQRQKKVKALHYEKVFHIVELSEFS